MQLAANKNLEELQVNCAAYLNTVRILQMRCYMLMGVKFNKRLLSHRVG